MIIAAFPDAPAPTYLSTLVESSTPQSKRVGSLPLPDWNCEFAGPWELSLQSGQAADSPISNLRRQIDTFHDDDEGDAPPTDSATTQALSTSTIAAALLASRWLKPRIATDGYGGLRLNWKKGSRELRAVYDAADRVKSYLYWEDERSYGSVRGFTGFTLFSFLDAFTSDKPFPRD